MSFQEDIRRYLDNETPTLLLRTYLGKLPTVRGTVYTATRWLEPSLMAVSVGPADTPEIPKQEGNEGQPVDAWEPRICEDGVIIRGPLSDDTAIQRGHRRWLQ